MLLQGPEKLHLERPITHPPPISQSPGERHAGAQHITAQWPKHWARRCSFYQSIARRKRVNTAISKNAFLISGRGSTWREQSSLARTRSESPSHPWLARPTFQEVAITCTRSTQCQIYSHLQPISHLPLFLTHSQTMKERARGGSGQVGARLARRYAYKLIRRRRPRRERSRSSSLVGPPECGCPIPRGICPDRNLASLA